MSYATQKSISRENSMYFPDKVKITPIDSLVVEVDRRGTIRFFRFVVFCILCALLFIVYQCATNPEYILSLAREFTEFFSIDNIRYILGA